MLHEEGEEALRCGRRGEPEIDDHVVVVVDWPGEARGQDARADPGVGEAVERFTPGRVLGDRVLDVESGH